MLSRLKHFFWDWARAAFRALPLSFETKIRVRDALFSLLGERARHLPGYLDWLHTKSSYRDMEIPLAELASTREYIWKAGYEKDTRPTFLFISHHLGGGTEHHVQAMGERLQREGFRVLVMRHLNPDRVFIENLIPDALRLTFDLEREFDAMVTLFSNAHIRHIHVHHSLHFPKTMLARIPELAKRLAVEFDFTFHDYFPICPRFTLFDDGVLGYCGEPVVSKCDACVNVYGSPLGKDVDVAAWRSHYAAFLRQARRVFTPNTDVTERIRRYVPELHLVTRPHEEVAFHFTPMAKPRAEGDVLQVVLIGAIAPHKGSYVLYECAKDALKRKLPIHFTVIGFTAIDHLIRPLDNVTITGPYAEAELPDLIARGTYHLSFFPGVLPETYSFTLSHAMRFGLHPVTFDIGAIAERIRAAQFGTILPLRDYRFPAKVNDALLALRPQVVTESDLRTAFTRYPSMLSDYYGLPASLVSVQKAA